MAISNGSYYGDSQREAYERDMFYRRQEEEYPRMQNAAYNPAQQQERLMHQERLMAQKPKPDPKDPLAFLNKEDNTLLLTGEAP